VKVSELGVQVEKDEWEHLELRRDSRGKPLVVEAVSRRVLPTEGYREELGLDHHEGRSWIGWYRHVLLVFLAFGYLTLLRLKEKNT